MKMFKLDKEITGHLTDIAPKIDDGDVFMKDVKRQLDLLPGPSKAEMAVDLWKKLSWHEYKLNSIFNFTLTGAGVVVVGGICMANFGAIVSFISMIISKI